MNRRARLRGLWLVALLLLGACNSGPSREEFQAEANQICADAEASLDRLGEEALANQDLSEITENASEQLTNLIDELEGLTPPDELSDDFDSMIEGLERATEDIDSLSTTVGDLQAGDQPDEETLQEVQEISQSMAANLDQATQAARDMNLEDCGQTTEGAGG
jgi:hypothetical protein